MIPKGLQHSHIQQAVEEINRQGVPNSRKSVRYDLLIDRKKYPPKYVISTANKYLDGKEWSPHDFIASEAKNYFIRRGYKILDREKSKIQSEVIESKYPEGKEKYKLHRHLERDTSIGKKVKEQRLDEVICDVCNFSFLDTYGELGAGFIEAHHTVPVSEMKGTRKTKANEIALVCSNCHRMLHSGENLLSIEELQEMLRKRVKSHNGDH